jgi:hypothetical protein
MFVLRMWLISILLVIGDCLLPSSSRSGTRNRQGTENISKHGYASETGRRVCLDITSEDESTSTTPFKDDLDDLEIGMKGWEDTKKRNTRSRTLNPSSTDSAIRARRSNVPSPSERSLSASSSASRHKNQQDQISNTTRREENTQAVHNASTSTLIPHARLLPATAQTSRRTEVKVVIPPRSSDKTRSIRRGSAYDTQDDVNLDRNRLMR